MTRVVIILFTIFIIFSCFSVVSAQQDCATAIPLTIASVYSGNNIGGTPDNNYSSQTGCMSSTYNSSYWYSFTVPPGVSSMEIIFTIGTLGLNSTITIVDDCTSSSSNSYLWYTCSPVSISGFSNIFCDLVSGNTYYIQVASFASEQGTYNIDVNINPLVPPNDLCANATPVFGIFFDCNDVGVFPMVANSNACPDVEATGNCVQNTDAGVWYTFNTGPVLGFSAVIANPVGHNFEMFSSTGGCANLQYEFCSGPEYVHDLLPNTTYYVLVEDDLWLQPFVSIDQTTCTGAIGVLNTGNGAGGSDLGLNSCVPGAPIMPCQNDNVVWYDYTVGCIMADITISVEKWDVGGPLAEIQEAGLMAMLPDCNTIMASYDPNGLGYICSGIVGNQELVLENLPPGFQFKIAIGSSDPEHGYFELFVAENSGTGGVNNDFCNDAIEIFIGPNLNFSNICATQDNITPSCPLNSQSSVWFEYDPSPNVEDITINLNPSTISSTVIAAYNDCSGDLIDVECGTTLELFCINAPIKILIGSPATNEGIFDLEVQSSPSQGSPDVISTVAGSCSGVNLNVLLEIPNGNIGDIIVTVASGNSPDLAGMLNHTYSNVNSAILNDNIINCSTVTQYAMYLVSSLVPGFNCPSSPTLVEIPIYPKFNTTPLDIEGCLDFEINVDISQVITGGTQPYQYHNWLLNGITTITNDPNLSNYTINGSGFIQVEVVDDNACSATEVINITGFIAEQAVLTVTQTPVCIGDFITVDLEGVFQNGGNVISSTWEIRDALGTIQNVGNQLIPGVFSINSTDLPPGLYTAEVVLEDDNGCFSISTPTQFEISPSLQGIIKLNQDSPCNPVLQVVFYDDFGNDIYNNGPDDNSDGIPDQFDIDNNNQLDALSITWSTPFSGDFVNNLLTFVPFENGIYGVEISMTSGCNLSLESPNINVPLNIPPLISGPSTVCAGDSALLSVTPTIYDYYRWSDSNNNTYNINAEQLIINPSESTTYYLEVEDAFGCIFVDSFSVIAFPNPIITLSGSTTICEGQSTIIDAGLIDSTWTYQWIDSLKNIINTDTSFLKFDTAGYYSVIVTNIQGCTDTASFIITEASQLVINVVGMDLCDNSISTLTAGLGFDSYLWTDILNNPLGTMPSLSISNPGQYILSATKGSCIGNDTITINQYTAPTVNIINDITICNGLDNDPDTLINLEILSQSSDLGVWRSIDLPTLDLTNLSAVNFNAIAAGTFRLEFTTNTANPPCVNLSDTLTVYVSNCACPILQVLPTLQICNIEMNFDLADLLSPQTEAGTWSYISGPQAINMTNNSVIDINGTPSGSYYFAYSLTNIPSSNCKAIDTVELIITASPIVEIVEKVTVCNAPSTIAPSIINLDDYVVAGIGNWRDPMIMGLDFSDPTNLDFTGIIPGDYYLYFQTSNAVSPCPNLLGSILLKVVDCDCPIIDLIPTVNLCTTDDQLDLSSLVNSGSASGDWSFITGPENLNISNSTLVDIENKQSGTYSFEYTLVPRPPNNCREKDTITIDLLAPPTIDLTPSVTVCNTPSNLAPNILNLQDYVLSGNGTWIDPQITGLDFTNQNNLDFENIPVGNYYIVFRSNNAILPCMNTSDSILINVIDCNCPILNLVDGIDICTDNTVIDFLDHVGLSDDGNWTASSNNPAPSIIVNNSVNLSNYPSGTYSYTYTLSNIQAGCPSSDSISFQMIAPPIIISTKDTTVCNTNSGTDDHIIDLSQLIITINSGEWFDSDGNLVSNPNAINFEGQIVGTSQVYTFRTTDALAPCLDIQANVSVLVKDCSCNDPIFLDPPALCNIGGEGIDLQDLLVSNHTGSWEIISGPFGSNSTLTGTYFSANKIIAGDYKVEFTIANQTNPNCQTTWDLDLHVANQDVASLGPNKVICTTNTNGESTNLDLYQSILEGNTNGYWLDIDGLTLNNADNLDFLDADPGAYIYKYIVENEPPCEHSIYEIQVVADTCNITIEKDVVITLPTIFSPNSDGTNDWFYPVTSIDIPIQTFSIFDRWGNKVFSNSDFTSNDPESGWNGLFNGQKVNQGVFLYMIQYASTSSNPKTLAGDITVVR